MTMINVQIDTVDALTLLNDRVKHWTGDNSVQKLYSDMYEHALESGCFDGIEFDVTSIVDNDYINYCEIISKGDEAFDKLLEIYNREGLTNVSCDDLDDYNISFIEAVDDEEIPGAFLVRL